ncbi:hypothetical protein QLQ12_44710 [Actinoplanes sp. NEAU-A12]|uniref:Uncharacterized protein n=1 Tax=Actinoplanes sandaracinus TaxID=3045177 RepID=A0ABT6X134_9ACTN|nr:hypothetical protein [Actinoplanes sandaracinus]MDI6105705.1 hypothetical protein [Actinoplanes sandaracinus]
MADDDMTASEGAILLVLMVEAREVLNTELTEKYGLNVRKAQRENLMDLKFIASRRSGSTNTLLLTDEGWRRVRKDLDFKLRGAGALGSALTALHAALRGRILTRAGCANLGELFAAADLRAPAQQELRLRIISAYDALADEPKAWVSLRRLRPFFADVSREDLDDALRRLVNEEGVDVTPEPSRRLLTEADIEAALRVGGQDNHLLAIGV